MPDMRGMLRWLWRQLKRACCCLGRRRASEAGADASSEQQALLRPDGPRSHRQPPAQAGHLLAAGLPLHSQQQQQQQQQQQGAATTLVVLRHGHRQDEEDPCWHQTAARPWDPPLSAKGKQQACSIAEELGQLGRFDAVVCSPFRRCLQTAAGVLQGGLAVSDGAWLVDWQLAEVCDPRVLFSSRQDARDRACGRGIGDWMWGGLPLKAALAKFVAQDCKLSRPPISPAPRSSSQPPPFPESLEQGLGRYGAALQDIGRAFAGQTVLVVTHGECVRQAVALAEPQSEVFEVKHTGYVVLSQQPRARAPGAWRISSEPGETGVLWLEDDDD